MGELQRLNGVTFGGAEQNRGGKSLLLTEHWVEEVVEKKIPSGKRRGNA